MDHMLFPGEKQSLSLTKAIEMSLFILVVSNCSEKSYNKRGNKAYNQQH